MRTALIRASIALITFILLTTLVVAQGPDTKSQPTYRWQCDGCVSKVIQLPSSLSPFEMQQFANLFRIVVELRILTQDPLQHTISITCTPEELSVVEKLVAALEDLRLGGDLRRSILVYEPQSPPPLEEPTQKPRRWKPEPDLAFSFIKAFYLPNSSPEHMKSLTDILRKATQISRIQMFPSDHIIVIRGTSEQIAQADSRINE